MGDFESKTVSGVEYGGVIAGSGAPAYRLQKPARPNLPVLIAAPHAGRDYPQDIIERMREPHFAKMRLEDRYVDRLAMEVALKVNAAIITARAPRAMLDLNRSREDVDWGMVRGASSRDMAHSHANRRARSGLGLVPRRLPGHGEIWKSHLSIAELDTRAKGIHRPYHAAVARELETIRDEWGAALLLDFHSMPPLKQSYGRNGIPRFVVGDRFGASCDENLTSRACRHLEERGWVTAHNRPYSGGYVLDVHGVPARDLHAIQLEICRSIYLDEIFDQPSSKMSEIAELVAGLVRELGAATARLARPGHLQNAAE